MVEALQSNVTLYRSTEYEPSNTSETNIRQLKKYPNRFWVSKTASCPTSIFDLIFFQSYLFNKYQTSFSLDSDDWIIMGKFIFNRDYTHLGININLYRLKLVLDLAPKHFIVKNIVQ